MPLITTSLCSTQPGKQAAKPSATLHAGAEADKLRSSREWPESREELLSVEGVVADGQVVEAGSSSLLPIVEVEETTGSSPT